MYPVQLGPSFTKSAGSFHTLQYSFKPASLEGGGKGSIEVSGSQVTVEATPNSGGAAVQFKGTWSDAKEGECVLIWEDGSFRLEKLSSTAKALRPISSGNATRAAAKRPRTPGQRTPSTSRKASLTRQQAQASATTESGEKEEEEEEEELDEARVDAELEDLLAAD